MKKRILAAAALLALLCALAGCASPEEQKPQSIYPAIEWQTYGSLSLPASLPLPSFSPAGETDGVFRYSPVSEDDLQAYLDQVRQAGYQAYNAGRDFVIAGEHLGAVVSLEGSTCTIAFHPRRSSAGSGYLSQSDAIGKLNLAGAFVLIDRTTDELYSQTGMQLFWGCSQPQSAADPVLDYYYLIGPEGSLFLPHNPDEARMICRDYDRDGTTELLCVAYGTGETTSFFLTAYALENGKPVQKLSDHYYPAPALIRSFETDENGALIANVLLLNDTSRTEARFECRLVNDHFLFYEGDTLMMTPRIY